MKAAVLAAALAAQLGVARAQGMGSGSCPCVSTVRAAPAPALRPLRACALRPLRLSLTAWRVQRPAGAQADGSYAVTIGSQTLT